MMHKIRSLMGKVEENKLLANVVEMKDLVMTTITAGPRLPTKGSKQKGPSANTKHLA